MENFSFPCFTHVPPMSYPCACHVRTCKCVPYACLMRALLTPYTKMFPLQRNKNKPPAKTI